MHANSNPKYNTQHYYEDQKSFLFNPTFLLLGVYILVLKQVSYFSQTFVQLKTLTSKLGIGKLNETTTGLRKRIVFSHQV